MMQAMGWSNPNREYSKTDAATDLGRVGLLGGGGAVMTVIGWGLIKSGEFARDAAVNMLANNCTAYDDNPEHAYLRVCNDSYAAQTQAGMFGEDSHGYDLKLIIAGAITIAAPLVYVLAHRLIGAGGDPGHQ